MNYLKIYDCDMVNGEGVRVTLFLSGCDHACRGCYNQYSWNPDHGEKFTELLQQRVLDMVDLPHISGLSLTGGDPLYHGNLPDVLGLLRNFRARFGSTKNVWLWSGYTLGEINSGGYGEGEMRREIVSLVDVFIDGRFEQDKHDANLPFRGSSNQIIHRFTEF